MNRWINRFAALALVGVVLLVTAAPAAAQTSPAAAPVLGWGSEGELKFGLLLQAW